MEEEKVLSYLSYSENEMTKNFCDLLITLGVIDYPNNRIKTLSVPFRSKTEITKITEKFQQYDLYDDVLLDLDKLYLFLSDKYP